jgi:F0F1-type ATP synthase alpha subunit
VRHARLSTERELDARTADRRVPVEKVREFEQEYLSFLENAKGSLLEAIRTEKSLSDDLKSQLKGATEEFKARYASKAKGTTA